MAKLTYSAAKGLPFEGDLLAVLVSGQNPDGTAWTLPTGEGAATAIADGRKTVTTAGTRVTLVASTTPCKEVTITAMLANTGVVVIGGATVVASQSTRQGTPLSAGDSLTIAIDDLVKINLDATVSGEGVVFHYLT